MIGKEFNELEKRLTAVDKNLDRLSIPRWKYAAYGVGLAALCFLTVYFGIKNFSRKKELEMLKALPPAERTVPKDEYNTLDARHSQLELNLAKSRLEIARAKQADFKYDAENERLDGYDAETAKRKAKLDEMLSEGWADSPCVPAAAD